MKGGGEEQPWLLPAPSPATVALVLQQDLVLPGTSESGGQSTPDPDTIQKLTFHPQVAKTKGSAWDVADSNTHPDIRGYVPVPT
jgi:hypothetical protein